MSRVVIVGASVAGIRTVQSLRQQGFDGEIVLIGAEPHHPYDKPPLSKGQLAPEATDVAPPLLSDEQLAELNVELHLGVTATGVSPDQNLLHTDAGDHPYDHLVIATGMTPRTLPGADLDGVHTIRTAEDSKAVRARLATGPRVVVIGAGFIGAEFAAAARAQGCAVTIVEVQDTPLAHLVGDRVGSRLAEMHQQHDVTVLTGARFERFLGETAVTGVELADGTQLPADLVVVGIGAIPATDWLAGSGLPINNGIDCAADLRVIGYPNIFAAGDVARWPHAHYQEPMRIEHWTNASEHGAMVAAVITGGREPRTQVPYVWSDQYEHRIQIVGLPNRGTLAHLSGGGPEDLVAVYADEAGQAIAAVVVNDPRGFVKLRKAITKGTDVAELDLPETSTPV